MRDWAVPAFLKCFFGVAGFSCFEWAMCQRVGVTVPLSPCIVDFLNAHISIKNIIINITVGCAGTAARRALLTRVGCYAAVWVAPAADLLLPSV